MIALNTAACEGNQLTIKASSIQIDGSGTREGASSLVSYISMATVSGPGLAHLATLGFGLGTDSITFRHSWDTANVPRHITLIH